MADVLAITTGFYTLDLRSALLLDTWRTTFLGNGLVNESFQVAFTGTDATLRTSIETLMRFRQRCIDYWSDPSMGDYVYLRAYSDGETGTQALIYSIEFTPVVGESSQTPLLGRGAVIYQINIVRDEAWEVQVGTVLLSTDDLSCNGGRLLLDPGSSFYGSLNSRILYASITDGPATPIYRLWMGIQPYYPTTGYTLVNARFDATWEAEEGTAVAGSFVNDATANPAGTSSNTLEVTTVPASLTRAWWSRLSNHEGTNTAAYYGDWLILGRMKVNAGTVGVQLRSGLGTSSTDALMSERINEMIYVSNTGWRLLELGTVRFPVVTTIQDIGPSLNNSCLSVFIQQISGTTTSFKLDEIILIPAKHLAKATKTSVSTGGVSTSFNTREDWTHSCSVSADTSVPEATFNNWGWPYQGGFLVIAGEGETAHVLTDDVDIDFLMYKRYLGHAI